MKQNSQPELPFGDVCDQCQGTGYINHAVCLTCRGTGRVGPVRHVPKRSKRSRNTDPVTSHEAVEETPDIKVFELDSDSGRMFLEFAKTPLTAEEAAALAWPVENFRRRSHRKRASDLELAGYIEEFKVPDPVTGELVLAKRQNASGRWARILRITDPAGIAAHKRMVTTGST